MKEWIFNIEDFKTNRIAIFCRGEEERKAFLDVARKYKIEISSSVALYGASTTSQFCCYYYQNNKLKAIHPFSMTAMDYKIIGYPSILFKDNIIEDAPFISVEELNQRGLKTGDIVVVKSGDTAIVINEWFSYINIKGWDDADISDVKQIIPVEKISDADSLPAHISAFIRKHIVSTELSNAFLTVVNSTEEVKEVYIYQVEFTPNGKLYDFLAEDNLENFKDMQIGTMVECNTKNGSRKYARIKNIERRVITKHEYSSEYKFCRLIGK